MPDERSFTDSYLAPTPRSWRAALFLVVLFLGGAAYGLRHYLGLQVQSVVGIICLICLAACFSKNLRAVNWRTIAFGLGLQLLLGILILKWRLWGLTWLGIPDGFRPGYALFEAIGEAVRKFIDFSNVGAGFVFGQLSNPVKIKDVFDLKNVNDAVIVAFTVLPPIIFISSFFSILYYFGVLQFIVRLMAKVMMYLMKTSGAETLSAAANVFMGQTEAPLIVKPYINRMTQSELLTMMAGGMATIAGSLLVVYASFGADRVALLATSVMAAPCGLYLSKLILPETETPETSGVLAITEKETHANFIDAAAAGASDGMRLAINVAAMLIAFLALLAMVDFLLGQLATGDSLWNTIQRTTGWMNVVNFLLVGFGYFMVLLLLNFVLKQLGWRPAHEIFGADGAGQKLANAAVLLVGFVLFIFALNYLLAVLPHNLQLKHIFAFVFSPLAFLIGIPEKDVPIVANLLGTKIAANEFVAFLALNIAQQPQLDQLGPDRVASAVGLLGTPPGLGSLQALPAVTPQPPLERRSVVLASYALTGFANFGSVGIQIGGIGAIAPERRSDLARLGMRALFVGFLVTLINAAVAGMLSE